MTSESENDLVAVHFADARNGYVAGAFSTLLRTSDGGESAWTPVENSCECQFCQRSGEVSR